MARLYLTLYGVLFITIGLFYASLIWVPELVLRGAKQDYYERFMYGVYDLVESRLAASSPPEWDGVIEDLTTEFPHGLALYTIDDLPVAEKEKRRLQSGELVFVDDKEQTLFYKRVEDSNRYLMLALGPSAEQREQQEARGIVNLIELRYLGRDESEWPAITAEIKQSFKLPMELVKLDDASLPEDRRKDIEAGELVILGLDQKAQTYILRLGQSDWVLYSGPLTVPSLLHYFNYILLLVLAMLLAMAVYLWVMPVWRDLKRIDKGVRHFGAGDLDTRLEVRKRSAVKPLADTFNAMAERMQRLIDSHKELTSAVSHELRTPIARLRFRVDMLEEPLSSGDFNRHINAMRKDIVELEELVSESLSYSRFDRERPELVWEMVPLGEWLESLLEELGDELLAVEVSLQSADGLAATRQVSLDTRLMGRAVKNLLRNAHRHASQHIQLSYRLSDGQARIIIEDDGSGVPEQERERIFAPFARLDAARDRESGGVGLGLAIVNQICRWHQGRAWVEEADLGGARFVIEWPTARPD